MDCKDIIDLPVANAKELIATGHSGTI